MQLSSCCYRYQYRVVRFGSKLFCETGNIHFGINYLIQLFVQQLGIQRNTFWFSPLLIYIFFINTKQGLNNSGSHEELLYDWVHVTCRSSITQPNKTNWCSAIYWGHVLKWKGGNKCSQRAHWGWAQVGSKHFHFGHQTKVPGNAQNTCIFNC